MSKAVRIREHLYTEIERLARQERRSIIGQLEVLLEQALRLTTDADAQPRDVQAREVKPAAPPENPSHLHSEVKSDFKEKRK